LKDSVTDNLTRDDMDILFLALKEYRSNSLTSLRKVMIEKSKGAVSQEDCDYWTRVYNNVIIDIENVSDKVCNMIGEFWKDSELINKEESE